MAIDADIAGVGGEAEDRAQIADVDEAVEPADILVSVLVPDDMALVAGADKRGAEDACDYQTEAHRVMAIGSYVAVEFDVVDATMGAGVTDEADTEVTDVVVVGPGGSVEVVDHRDWVGMGQQHTVLEHVRAEVDRDKRS